MELAAIVSTRAQFATAQADHTTAEARYQDLIDHLAALPTGRARDEGLIAALIGLGHSQRLQGAHQDARTHLDAALDLTLRSGQHSVLVAAAHNALGVLAKDTGHYADAARHYGHAIDALDRVGDAEDPALMMRATLQHNLAGLAHVQGRFVDAEPPARRAIGLRRRASEAGETDVAADETVWVPRTLSRHACGFRELCHVMRPAHTRV